MPARAERSAGVVVFYLPSDDPSQPHFLLLDYGKYWDYPKGHVETGEDDPTAALRELREETGIADAELIDGFRHEMTYFFRDRRKGLIRKTVVFFLGRTLTRDVTISHEHVGGGFFPYVVALDQLTYPNAKETLRAAKAYLEATGTGAT